MIWYCGQAEAVFSEASTVVWLTLARLWYPAALSRR